MFCLKSLLKIKKFNIFMLIVFCLISYSNSLKGYFVFDDTVAIVNNKDVTEITSTLHSIFTHDFWGASITDPSSHKSYRPLTILMFHFEYNYMNLTSFGMKIINLQIHCLNTWLSFILFSELTNDSKISLLAGILFATNPVHTEAVCGIVGRTELMFCLCLLLSINIFISISWEDSRNAITKCSLVVILSSLGLLFKETGITIIPLCVLIDLIRNKIFIKSRHAVLFCITGILLYARLYVQKFESPKFKPMDNPISANEILLTRILSQNYLYVLNCWIIICPQWLCFDWALDCVKLISSFFDIRCLSILPLYYIIYKMINCRNTTVLISLVLTIVPFLPASGILKVGFVIGERILYVPSLGMCLIISNGFFRLQYRLLKYKNYCNIIIITVIIIFIFRTRQRASEWLTEEKLFSSGVLVCPNNAKIHYNIARLSTDKGKIKKAFKYYHNAIRLYPDYDAALMNIGNLYREIKDFSSAEKYIKKSINAQEDFPAAWMNLGIVQASQKKYDDALASYKNALKYRRRYSICYYNLGNLYLNMQDYSQAILHWQESVALNPNQPKAWTNILTLLDNQSLWEDALRISEQAIHHLPHDNTIHFIRANIHGKLKKYYEAERIYQKIIHSEPENSLFYTNLAVLYHRWNKLDLAITNYKHALVINPNSRTAKINLKKLLNRS